MSTKVYSGFKWRATALDTVFRQLEMSSEALRALQRQAYCKTFAHLMARKVDDVLMLPHGRAAAAADPLGYLVRREICDRQLEVLTTQRRDPAVDFEISLLFWYSERVESLVGYVASEMNSAVLRALQGVTDPYAYWNNTDPDPDVSDEEWALRSVVWQEVLTDSKPAVRFVLDNQGVMLEPPSEDELRSSMPDTATRARDYAEAAVYETWRIAQTETDDSPMSLYLRFRRELVRDVALRGAYEQALIRVAEQLMPLDALLECRPCPLNAIELPK